MLYQLDPGNLKSLDICQVVPDNGAESTRSMFRNMQLYMFSLSQLSSLFSKHFCKIQTQITERRGGAAQFVLCCLCVRNFLRITWFFPLKSTVQPSLLLEVVQHDLRATSRWKSTAPIYYFGRSMLDSFRFQLDGNMAEEGRKRKEIKLKNWKAVSYHLPHYSDRRISVTLSSIPCICPPPSAPACRKQQRGRGGEALPSHLGHQAEPRSLVGVWFWHVACVLCRAGPSSLALWTF